MSHAPSSSESAWQRWRGAILVAVVAAICWWACLRSPAFWVQSGMGEPNRPFLDLYGLLAASDAVAHGLDPFQPNLLDPYHRPLLYSEWWLVTASWGWGRKDVLWLGFTLAGALLLTAVTMARPRTWSQAVQLLLLLVSPAFLLAVHRANNDLVILVTVSLGLLCFRRQETVWRVLGVLLFALSAVLKYYPLTTVVMLLALPDRRSVRWGAALYALVLVLAGPSVISGLRVATDNMPGPIWLYTYGAPALMRDLELNSPWIWLAPGVLILAWALVQAWRQPWAVAPVPPDAAEREFVCGAIMLVGLFFLGATYVYKLVFAIWLLPWLWQQEPGREYRRGRQIVAGLLAATVWIEGLLAIGLNGLSEGRSPEVNQAILKGGLVVVQLLAWALVAGLSRFLLVYLVRWLRRLQGAGSVQTG